MKIPINILHIHFHLHFLSFSKLETQLQLLSTTSSAQIADFLSAHQRFLLQIIEDMQQLSVDIPYIYPLI